MTETVTLTLTWHECPDDHGYGLVLRDPDGGAFAHVAAQHGGGGTLTAFVRDQDGVERTFGQSEPHGNFGPGNPAPWSPPANVGSYNVGVGWIEQWLKRQYYNLEFDRNAVRMFDDEIRTAGDDQ